MRIAPSPTGHMHVGLARTALFNWLFARQAEGEFLLRIEDTDIERSEKKYEDEIIQGLSWLGLNWDGEVYRQSDRREVYKKYLKKLIEENKAYYCYCAKEELEAQRQEMIAEGLVPKYNGRCRSLDKVDAKKPSVIRLKIPEIKIEFKDLIRGKVEFDVGLFGDLVIAKNLENPLYNFAVVVDDEEMKISHVIRGEDHISNTPRQILIGQALRFQMPIYAHIPLILAPDRSKLSKRSNEVSLLEYKERGYLPEAMVNFLGFLGWHPEGDDEILDLKKMVQLFDIAKIQKGGAVFNQEKLDWFNNQYLRKLSAEEIYECLKPFLKENKIESPPSFIKKVIEVLKERMKTLIEFFELADFFFNLPEYDVSLLKWKDQSLPDVKIILEKIFEAFSGVSDSEFHSKKLGEILNSLINGTPRGEVFWPLRVALSGKNASPDPLMITEVLAKIETVRRIELAIGKI